MTKADMIVILCLKAIETGWIEEYDELERAVELIQKKHFGEAAEVIQLLCTSVPYVGPIHNIINACYVHCAARESL
jgi:hypothetical protein